MRWIVILLSLLPASITQNIDDAANVDEPEVFLSNETIEQNSGPQKKDNDLKLTTIPDASEVEAENPVEVSESSDCGHPPVVGHAHTDGGGRTSYEIGSKLTYYCEFGYSTDGTNHISQCVILKEGDKPAWTDPEINCIPRSCEDPGLVLNAHRIGSRFTFPNQVSFECDDGYELKGSGVRYCQVSGKWSGSLPSCEKIFCDQPFHPENGRVILTSLEYGSQLKYECEKGFILKNDQTRICSENGTWSGPEPFCLDAQCDVPISPEYGSFELVGGNTRVGAIVIYRCESDKMLVGSSTSKCLEIGEWTFSAPICVDPCTVPNVQHGNIGRYETKKWNRERVYSQLPAGASLKDGEELYLRCDDRYEPLGKNKREEQITCEKGQWVETPSCEPARCRAKPPDMENGRPASINRHHRGYVVYHCLRHFNKTKYGNITCNFGTWRGIPPTCSDMRCYADRIQFPGVLKGNKNMFNDKEAFKFRCEKGYTATTDGMLVCEAGTWRGHLPPCKAASCLTSPPSIENGRIKSYSEVHSAMVSYECDENYFLLPSDVQCLFGEWKGILPLCRDGRCYFQNLKYRYGMIAPLKDSVRNGETVEVRCSAGYSSLSIRPLCSDGQWTEYGTSPCKPNNCPVVQIANGAFTQRIAKNVWHILKGRGTEITFQAERIGSVKSSGERLHVVCDQPHSFQGRDWNYVEVVCSEGRWTPTPVCLRYGSFYEERRELPENLAARTTNPLPTTPSAVAAFESTTDGTATEQTQVVDCHCLYEGPNDLVAYSDKELLRAGMKVKANASVKFHCLHIGYHRFEGPKEIVCKDCKPWPSSEYPYCVQPVRGDVILKLDADLKILPGGILSIDQGVDAQLSCSSIGIADYPVWFSTAARNRLITHDSRDQSNDVYSNVLSIRNANPLHSGFYKCSVAGRRALGIQICVHTRCKKFDENEELVIFYDNKQEVNSSAMFTCKDSGSKLEGSSVLTCLSNGEWSGDLPGCLFKGCPVLAEPNAVLITYSSSDRSKGSTATFHCYEPRVRKGPPFIQCLPNGDWSGSAPTCILPSCPLERLFEHIPENVVPQIEDVSNETLPLGSELQLTCEGDLRLAEPAAARCGNNGDWEVPVVNCVPGCAPIQVPLTSHLIVDPKRDFYRFGEYVSLYCNPGHVLSAEVEILMCLRNGWSDSAIPSCVDPSSLTEEE